MNRIKIIKRENIRLPLEMNRADLKNPDAPYQSRRAARAVGDWIDEWRASKTRDARRAFDDLFVSPSAIV